MRQRSETIGTLGRSPARTTKTPEGGTSVPPQQPPPPQRGRVATWVHDALFENVGLKFLSLVLAVTVFLLITTDEARDITVSLPVKYNFPQDKFVLVSEQLQEVKVTLKGPWRRLRPGDFHERQLGDVTFDLRDAPTGIIAITPDMVRNVPPGVEVTTVSPQTVRVAFDYKIAKTVEVAPAVAGKPLHGYVIDEIKASPSTVTVRGAQRLLGALTSIRTTEVSIEGRTDSFDQLADIVTPEGVSPVDNTQKIAVAVRFKLELVTRLIPDVPVAAAGEGIDPTRWKVEPAAVEVTLTGPLLHIEASRSAMRAKAIIAPGDKSGREVKVVLEGHKEGVGVKITPERVKVLPVKPAPP